MTGTIIFTLSRGTHVGSSFTSITVEPVRAVAAEPFSLILQPHIKHVHTHPGIELVCIQHVTYCTIAIICTWDGLTIVNHLLAKLSTETKFTDTVESIDFILKGYICGSLG